MVAVEKAEINIEMYDISEEDLNKVLKTLQNYLKEKCRQVSIELINKEGSWYEW